MPKVEYSVTRGIVQSAASGGGSFSIVGNVVSNYMRFVAGDWYGLSLTTINDTTADAGVTLVDGDFYQAAWDGDGACAVVLPSAKAGALAVWRFTAQADGGADITFTTATGDLYAAQSLNLDVSNLGDALGVLRYIKATDFVQTVATHGGAIKSANGSSNNILTLASTATNNQTNIGAELAFFCVSDGSWRVAFRGSELGTGAINATFAFSG
jgi:hypothetical protein